MILNKYARIVSSLAASGLLLAGFFLLVSGAPQPARAAPVNLFVTYSGGGDCSQASPCDLQTALSTAIDGDSIYIAAGTYSGSGAAVITVTHSITIYGGWNGSLAFPPVRNPSSYRVTIDGANTRRGVYVKSGLTVTLDGMTITNGRHVGAYQGAGLYARDAHLTLRQMTFYRNLIEVFSIPSSDAYGAGAMVGGGTLLVDDSTFQENNAHASNAGYGGGLVISYTTAATVTNSLFQDNDSWWGSGLFFWGKPGPLTPFTLRDSVFMGNGFDTSPGAGYGGYAAAIRISSARANLVGNTITNNRASNDYGALSFNYGDLLMNRNTITGNVNGRTAGLHLSYASPFTLTNNIIAGNVTLNISFRVNPALRVTGGSGKFLHNTIADNKSNYGVLVDSAGVAVLTDTIIVSHTLGISVTSGSTAALQGTLWGSGDWANGIDWGGAGAISTGTVNIWGDPAFIAPNVYDYHIGPDSAAIDAGVASPVTSDIDGERRPIGAGFDIGADEYVKYVYLPVVSKH